MVRAPCCEKMGLKKGPWAQDEDHIHVSYIQRDGHGNWRALPKQAGLLRCGKSCRLRWTNYLRPDIKRGNFSKEEEDMIISLHEMLGNRWSAIAATLPGRTDNEIKNVWHTHLRKRLNPYQLNSVEEPKRKPRSQAKTGIESKPAPFQPNTVEFASNHNTNMQMNSTVMSPDQWTSHSDLSYSGTSSCMVTKSMDSCSQEVLEIDESFWNDALSMDATQAPGHTLSSSNDEAVDFWLRIFLEAGEMHDLSELSGKLMNA